MNISATLLSLQQGTNIPSLRTHFKRVPLVAIWLLTVVCATAKQRDDSTIVNTQVPVSDTTHLSFVKRAQKAGLKLNQQYISTFAEERIALKQEKIMDATKKTMEKAKRYLRSGIDTSGIRTELENIKKWSAIAGDGIFTNGGTAHSYRNLTTSYNLLLVLQKKPRT